jgi:predicted RNase H-like HicB family nuclease
MRRAGISLPYRHSLARVSQGKTEAEAKKNSAEAIELHLSALARDGIPLYQRPGTKETFVAVDI